MKQFNIIEDDGVVIYDESDDYDPSENECGEVSGNGDNESPLLSNQEIFTDEYMHNYAKKMEERIARENRNQRFISIAVVAAIMLFIGFVSYLKFKDVL